MTDAEKATAGQTEPTLGPLGPDTKEEWDKERQAKDQEKAAEHKKQLEEVESKAQRAREEADALAEAQQVAQDKITKLEQQLSQTQQSIQTKKDELDAMDDDLVDKSVINNLKKMEAKSARQEQQLEELQLKAKAYEEAEQARTIKAQKAESREKILKPLDEEFGGKYRNDALKLADEMVDKGTVKQPQDVIEAMTLMRKCYKQVVENKQKKEKSSVPSDSGGGGLGHRPDQRKTGSRQDVLADMQKDKSWKTGT